MWLFALSALAAEPRQVIYRVMPDQPVADASCTALLSVSAEGAVTVEKVAKCPSYKAIATEALSKWRYAPAPEATTEEATLSFKQGATPRLLVRSTPLWSEEERTDVSGCFAHLWIGTEGRIDQVEINGCEEPAKSKFEEAIFQWRFARSEQPWETLSVASASERELLTRTFPRYPQGETLPYTRCTILLVVDAQGDATIREEIGCPEPFATAASEAVARWRWRKGDHASVEIVSVSFKKN